MPVDKFANMEEKLWILEDLNMMYIRQIALSLQVKVDFNFQLTITCVWLPARVYLLCCRQFLHNLKALGCVSVCVIMYQTVLLFFFSRLIDCPP